MSDALHRQRAAFCGALLTSLAVLAQSLWMLARYPAARLDADLLSYLTYYRDWRSGTAVTFGYTVPKVLPLIVFGPAGSPDFAWAVSTVVAVLGGGIIFLVTAEAFGLATAVIAAAAYVLDPLRSVLTLRSSVDLYIGVALLVAVLALQRQAVLWAGAAILVAALGKPIAIACALALLLARGVPLRRRLLAMALPLMALPATAMMNAMLEGRPAVSGLIGFALPEQHARFVQVAQGRPLDWMGTLELLFAEWFGGLLFARTWPLAAIGVVLCLVGVWRGFRGEAEGSHRSADDRFFVLLVPLLLGLAYVGLSTIRPFVVFTRFFWPLAVALTIFAAYGATALASRAPLSRSLRAALVGVLALALFADRFDDYRWRERLMLSPYQGHASIADRGVAAIADEALCTGPAVVPLAYLPLAAWRAPQKLHRGELCSTEDWADGRGCAEPRCVLVIPDAPTTERAQQAVARLVGSGYAVEVADEAGLLIRSTRG